MGILVTLPYIESQKREKPPPTCMTSFMNAIRTESRTFLLKFNSKATFGREKCPFLKAAKIYKL